MTKLDVVKVVSLKMNNCEFLVLLFAYPSFFFGNLALTNHKQNTHNTIYCRYSIEHAVSDLKQLIRSLDLNKFHILGHSFGGVVAYEYVKSSLEDDDQHHDCLSLTLANTPSNMELSHEESCRLLRLINEEFMLENNDAAGTASDMPVSRIVNDRFRKRHECRTEHVPEPLVTAIQGRGLTFGPEAVRDFIAFPPASYRLHSSSPRSVNASNKLMPPVLLIRGEHDFVTEECVRGWRKIFTTDVTVGFREEVMNNCAHYCHLENPQGFCELIKNQCFINDY
jgi:pimeloyl-ACP methyl ester carboxylesterase